MSSGAIFQSREHLAAPFAPQILTYALVTPARNEAAFIEQTIRCVIAQTALPRRWIIVSDGSTDGTDEIVQRYAREHDWIELLRMPERRDRQFAAKANAFNAGYARLARLPFDIIGNLDADITFEPDYFSFLLSKFQLFPELGVAGTPFVEDHDRIDQHSYAHQFANSTHVSGGCQMFQKKCFGEIGGYVPVKAGAIDWIAVTTARMKGWQTRTFTEKVCFHHRELGVGSSHALSLRLQSLPCRRPSSVGMSARFVSDAAETICPGRRMVHRRIYLGRLAPQRARSFSGTNAVPPGRTDGAVARGIYSSLPGRLKVNTTVDLPCQTSRPVELV
jgi:hypothetical protein